MIRSIRHKGLREVFRDGRSAKVPSELEGRIRRRLDVLDQARELADVNLPGYDLHTLQGHQPPRYAISVNGPWRITFGWDRGEAIAVKIEQYHQGIPMTTATDNVERPQRVPTHPGEVLREDVLPALGVTVTQAARDMGISRMTLHRVLTERTSVTPEMALRLGRYCGNGPDLWLRMQDAHDLWHARQKLGEKIEKIPERKIAAA